MLIKFLFLAVIFVACGVCLTNASEDYKPTDDPNQDKSTSRVDLVRTLLEEIAHLKIDTKPIGLSAAGSSKENDSNPKQAKDDHAKQKKYSSRPISACHDSLGLATSGYWLLCRRQSNADKFKLDEQYEINPIVRRMWKMTGTRTRPAGDGVGG